MAGGKRGKRKFRCATCGHEQFVHWTERVRRFIARCTACGSAALDVVSEAAREELRSEGSNAAQRRSVVGAESSPETLSILDDALTSRDWNVRRRAFAELRAGGMSFDVVVPRALTLLSDLSPSIRKDARAFLTSRLEDHDGIARAIVAARNHPDPAVRSAAAAWQGEDLAGGST